MSNSNSYEWANLTNLGRAIVIIGAVVGYGVSWFLRQQAGHTGVLHGALYGGLGTGAGVFLSYIVVALVPGTRQVSGDDP